MPSGRSITFSGLRSRWTTPAAWAIVKADAICTAMSSASRRNIGSAGQTIAQRLAVDVFHRDEVRPSARPAQRMNRADVGIIERGGGTGLLLEAAHTVGIGRDCGREQLDGDAARELGIGGEPDFAHSSRAKQAHEVVLVETAASSQRNKMSADYTR